MTDEIRDREDGVTAFVDSGWKYFLDGRDWMHPDLHDLYDNCFADPSPGNLRNALRDAFSRGLERGYKNGELCAKNEMWENDGK